jgi:hypothetical protein
VGESGVRRQANVKGGRVVRYDVRVSEEQAEVLTTRALTEGVTVPKLLVDTTLGTPPVNDKATLRELASVRRIQSGVATNINQLAHVANAGGTVPAEELEALRAAVDQQNDMLAKRFGEPK